RPGPDRVVAPTADEDALAAAAGDRVDARAPDEDVAQRVARQRVAAAAAADVLDAGDPAGGGGGGAGRQVHRDGGGVRRIVQPVAARPAVDDPGDARAVAEDELVDARAAGQVGDAGEGDAVDVTGVRAGDGPDIGDVGALERRGAAA